LTLASLVDWYAGRWPESGFIGYPLASLVVVPTAGVALALNMLVDNALMIPLALALTEYRPD